jgi:hypothetical protein
LLCDRGAALLDRSGGSLQGLRACVCQELVASIGESPARLWRRRFAKLAFDRAQSGESFCRALVARREAGKLICQHA